MQDQLRVKSPTGCVHIVECSYGVGKKVEYSTLCNHRDYYQSPPDGNTHLWDETTEKATCRRCISAHRRLKERQAIQQTATYLLKTWGLTKETTFSQAKRLMTWGTYGKLGNEPLEYVRLMDCSTGHLKAILTTQDQIIPLTRLIIESILEDRKA